MTAELARALGAVEPLARVTGSWQRHDSLAFAPLMAQPRIARRGGGRPDPARAGAGRQRPTRPLQSARTCASARSKPRFPGRADQAASRRRRGSSGGQPPAFDPAAYRQRNTVEQAFGTLRQHRTVATGFGKRDFVWTRRSAEAKLRKMARRGFAPESPGMGGQGHNPGGLRCAGPANRFGLVDLAQCVPYRADREVIWISVTVGRILTPVAERDET
jgi:hypothetical protein